jgi:chemotaxis protein MotB
MARKKKHAEHVNHERWLVSYADFITLLFAFFVVMFAVSQVDSKRVGRFTEAFSKAVGEDMFPGRGTSLLPEGQAIPEAAPEEKEGGAAELPEELKRVKEKLAQLASLNGDALAGLLVIQKRNELVLRLSDSVMFESGDDRLKAPALAMIHTLAPELAARSVDVRVEGHTDDRPISNARYRSNWDLSTARATAVIVRLSAEGIPDARLAAAGYGQFRPVAPNTSEEGRKQNRRVDLVVAVSVPEEPGKPVSSLGVDAGTAGKATPSAGADGGTPGRVTPSVGADAGASDEKTLPPPAAGEAKP